MFPKHLDDEREEPINANGLAAYETARIGGEMKMLPPTPPSEKKDDEKISLFWRVFGGTILSITALVVITLYNGINNSLSDIRSEVSREREARTALAKKDEVDSRIKTQYDRIRVVEGFKADIETVKERVTANAAAVESLRKDVGTSVDAIKKDMAGVEVLKERVASVETVRKDIASLDAVKEKLVGLSMDLKAARDEVQKLQQELEKNKASDLDRKMFRDEQAKQLDETLKEIRKDLQAYREKLARLEGALPSSTPAPKPKSE